MLYLDTARLGRMSPRAQHAQIDFARLAGAEGASPRFDRFLRFGFDSGDPQYPGLTDWRGIADLKQSLRHLAGSRPDLPVLLANRSAQLMSFAARLLTYSCRNVLATDLGWPAYHDILEARARREGRHVTVCPIRDAVLRAKVSADEMVELVCKEFVRRDCDGLFLSAVSNLGPRLPIERIVTAINAVREARFVVIDGAQDFCHVSADIRNEYCDLYLAGCHKWLEAFMPMGLAFYGRRRSQSFIEMALARQLHAGEVDDPLLRFASRLESDADGAGTETVNVAPLFSCRGATADAVAAPVVPSQQLALRLKNLSDVMETGLFAGWTPVLPHSTLRTGILLLQAENDRTRDASAEEIRSRFCDQGIALTAYPGGLVRLSMPDRPWTAGEIDVLRSAFRATMGGQS
jgi:hypothetical protein